MVVVRRFALVLLVSLVWAPAALAWSWPVHGPVLQPFAYDEAHPYAAGQHRGIDIGADNAGEPVVAPEAGIVSFAGSVPTSGLSITIETPDGYSVTLTHLGSLLVAKGAAVAEGAAVATIGPSGTPEVDGPYVHLGIRLTADPNGYLDPVTFLPAVETPTAPGSSGDPAPPVVASTSPGSTTPTTVPAPATAPVPSSIPSTAGSSAAPTAATAPARTGRVRPIAGHGAPAPGRTASAVSHDAAAKPDETRSAGADHAESEGKASRPGTGVDHGLGGMAGGPRTRHAVPGRTVPPQRPPQRLSLRPPLARPAPTLLSLALGIGPGVVASVVALVAFLGRRRPRKPETAVAGASVILLPLRRAESTEVVRAA